jgi:hypothetical protein
MKSIVALLLCVLMSATNAQSRPWNDEEKLLGTVALALHATDFAQTSYGIRQGYHEMNPIIGTHPHEDKLALMMISSAIGAYLFLDEYEKHRKVSLYAIIGVKSIIVGRHIGMGLKIRF